MAEPQPSDVREQVDNDEEHPTKLASAEDRKAAAALSSLDRPGDDDDKPPKGSEADQKALGEAMSKLEVTEKGTGPDGKIKAASETAKKKIKVDPVDVALLVSDNEDISENEHGSS